MAKLLSIKTKLMLFLSGLIVLFTLPAGSILAHGVDLEYSALNAIQVTATYDTGTPLADAQVAVFAPGNPAEPWLTGTTDSEGHFLFVPDPEIPGLWEVQVRLAGHGGLIRVAVEEGQYIPSAPAGLSGVQKALMTGAIIWGLIGTALYFSRRRN